MNTQDLDPLYRHFIALMRARDFAGAVRFFKDQLREALQGSDEDAISSAANLLIASLITGGPDREGLAMLWEVVSSLPRNVYFRSRFAEYLRYSLNEPEKALVVLEPVFEELVSEVGSRHATLGLRGAILFALGRLQDAEKCFRDMLQPSLWRMDPSAFDFRLVESLVLGGLMQEECEQYLKIAYHRAREAKDEGVMARADHLLRRLGMQPE